MQASIGKLIGSHIYPFRHFMQLADKLKGERVGLKAVRLWGQCFVS